MAINQMVKERWSCILVVQNKAASDISLQEGYVKAVSCTFFYKALLTKFGRMLNIAPFLCFCSELLRQKGITRKRAIKHPGTPCCCSSTKTQTGLSNILWSNFENDLSIFMYSVRKCVVQLHILSLCCCWLSLSEYFCILLLPRSPSVTTTSVWEFLHHSIMRKILALSCGNQEQTILTLLEPTFEMSLLFLR